VRVDVGLLAPEARETLGGYWRLHTSGRPRVTLKLAASLDGRIAPAGGFARAGSRRWLTGAPARRAVHRMRALSDAIVIGAGTARADDPRLTSRGVGSVRQPLRVVCDTRLALPLTLRLFRRPLARGTVVACGGAASRRAERELAAAGVRVWRVPGTGRGVSPRGLLRRMGREGLQEVLVEGGGRLARSFLEAGTVDRLALFTAPRVLGERGLPWCGPLRAPLAGRTVDHRRLGADTMVVVDLEV
jgi:diaminohydroxyphosphoribosylaminopyrimidine deaminase/5-amino-6-(5-phosphoribosylamino)uracil reductase